MAAPADPDTFAAWSIRQASARCGAWDVGPPRALLDPKRRDNATQARRRGWAPAVVEALAGAFRKRRAGRVSRRLVQTLGGLYRKYPEWSGHWFGTNPLAGQFPQKTRAVGRPAMIACRRADGRARPTRSPRPLPGRSPGPIVVATRPPRVPGGARDGGDPGKPRRTRPGDRRARRFPRRPLARGHRSGRPTAPSRCALPRSTALGRFAGPQALTSAVSPGLRPRGPRPRCRACLPALGRDGVCHRTTWPASSTTPTRTSAPRPSSPCPGPAGRSGGGPRGDPREDRRRRARRPPARWRPPSRSTPRSGAKLLASMLKVKRPGPRPRSPSAALPDPPGAARLSRGTRDRSPASASAGESALLAIRDSVNRRPRKAAKSGRYEGPAAARRWNAILTRFRPVTDWKRDRAVRPRRPRRCSSVSPRSTSSGPTPGARAGRSPGPTARRPAHRPGRARRLQGRRRRPRRVRLRHQRIARPLRLRLRRDRIRPRPAALAAGRLQRHDHRDAQRSEIAMFYRRFRGPCRMARQRPGPRPTCKGKNRARGRLGKGSALWSFSVQVSDRRLRILAAAGPGATGRESVPRLRPDARRRPKKAGEALFFDAKGIGCVKCHAAGGKGTANVGPDLTGLALKYDKAEIIRSVLEPSTGSPRAISRSCSPRATARSSPASSVPRPTPTWS